MPNIDASGIAVSWRRRIERAQELATRHAFASRLLEFYAQIASFQAELYSQLEKAASMIGQSKLGADSGPPELPALMKSFPRFLILIEHTAPKELAGFAHDLLSASDKTHTELLNAFWTGTGDFPTGGVREFPVRAFLQPYAEFVRVRSGRQSDGHTSYCSFCQRKPGMGVLRQQGDSGKRSLICSFCLAEWDFRRILCPNCGEEDHSKLPVFTAEELPHVRVECCDTCKCYTKTVDLTKNGLAEPIVDEIAAVPLDLWAQERGYRKLQTNLLQM